MIINTLNGKQRRFLRALGVNIVPVVYIGKEGVTPAITKASNEAIKKRELIKIRIGQNAPLTPEEAFIMLAERMSVNLVQIIGRNALFYKKNIKQPVIKLP